MIFPYVDSEPSFWSPACVTSARRRTMSLQQLVCLLAAILLGAPLAPRRLDYGNGSLEPLFVCPKAFGPTGPKSRRRNLLYNADFARFGEAVLSQRRGEVTPGNTEGPAGVPGQTRNLWTKSSRDFRNNLQRLCVLCVLRWWGILGSGQRHWLLQLPLAEGDVFEWFISPELCSAPNDPWGGGFRQTIGTDKDGVGRCCYCINDRLFCMKVVCTLHLLLL